MMQKFIIPKIHAIPSKATILGQDAKHISKVLRLTPGDPIEITDGDGKDYTAHIAAISPGIIEIDIIHERDVLTESPLHITLCSGLLKDKKMDLVIKHVTQLGIHKWIPFFCERSIPSPDEKRMEKRIDRWETIAKESLKQCRRSKLPQILAPLSFEKLLDHSATYDVKIAFWENATQKLDTLKKDPAALNIILLIGPEGGFSTAEIKMAKEKDFLSYSLGPRILRAETAAISSCTLIQHLLGDI
ncbi:MAG: 16S rRNA (uracil(1498)-N(3))-methyltransferase [Proteobacteria bacterium]|nr:16S rRNA (uracil(1498)-N(3))-methyltransferase [Pseudomonadota bacterium]MBU1582194.1 16S rRNA (uracil(1498)-N(3))-methyltransferase [Pseudomonadota bacterium]MBU2451770.1 16S rRNA (uracil(1498)-N(3))-methyltransferase [Pseudomonadota bacterium]MBU2627121.1 16S rRNA (uracil(1498)-N(3))-methyltransferase [Pseudomonadota bacterium]